MCVKDFLGLTTLDKEEKEGRRSEIVPGRLCGAKVCLPGGRNIACYSAYLWCSEKLSPRNRSILAELGQSVSAHRLEWVAGGDFNMTPSQLAKAGFERKCRGRMVAPQEPTCYGAGRPAVLDFFLVSAGLWQAEKQVVTTKCLAVRPHLIARLEFTEKLEEIEVTRMRWVRPVSKEPPLGPRAPQQDWREVKLDCEAALWRIRRREARSARRELEEVYKKFMRKTEAELRTATDGALDDEAEKRYRSRWGLEPRFVKEPLFKKEKEREDEEPSAVSLLIASKQRLLKAAEQLAREGRGFLRGSGEATESTTETDKQAAQGQRRERGEDQQRGGGPAGQQAAASQRTSRSSDGGGEAEKSSVAAGETTNERKERSYSRWSPRRRPRR